MHSLKAAVLLGFLAVGGTLALCEPAFAQRAWPSKWALELDGRLAQRVFEESVSKPTVHEVLTGALTIHGEVEQAGSTAITLYAFRIRDRKVIAKYQSRSFSAEAGRTVRVPERALPPDSWYGGNATADPAGFVPAHEFVPFDSAVRKAVGFVINGVFPDKKPDFEQHEIVYLVAMPATDASNKDGGTSPLLVVYGRLDSGR